jgi:hypothetical protein
VKDGSISDNSLIVSHFGIASGIVVFAVFIM